MVDHHALCWLDKHRDLSGRLARWALKLMEFDYTIKHKQVKLRVVPDCLLRNHIEEDDPTDEVKTNEIPMLKLQVEDISKLQEEDVDCRRLLEAVKYPEGATNADRRVARSYVIDSGVLYRRNTAHLESDRLVVVPERLRREILFECHGSPLSGGHLGFTKTFFKVKSRYYWPNMSKETEKYVKSCADCQTRKTPKQAPAGLLQPIPVGHPLDKIGIDFLGPFPKKQSWESVYYCSHRLRDKMGTHGLPQLRKQLSFSSIEISVSSVVRRRSFQTEGRTSNLPWSMSC